MEVFVGILGFVFGLLTGCLWGCGHAESLLKSMRERYENRMIELQDRITALEEVK